MRRGLAGCCAPLAFKWLQKLCVFGLRGGCLGPARARLLGTCAQTLAGLAAASRVAAAHGRLCHDVSHACVWLSPCMAVLEPTAHRAVHAEMDVLAATARHAMQDSIMRLLERHYGPLRSYMHAD